MIARHGDGVDPDGFPEPAPHGPRVRILVTVEQVGVDRVNASVSTDPPGYPRTEVAHDLRTVADLLESAGAVGITSTGEITGECWP